MSGCGVKASPEGFGQQVERGCAGGDCFLGASEILLWVIGFPASMCSHVLPFAEAQHIKLLLKNEADGLS